MLQGAVQTPLLKFYFLNSSAAGLSAIRASMCSMQLNLSTSSRGRTQGRGRHVLLCRMRVPSIYLSDTDNNHQRRTFWGKSTILFPTKYRSNYNNAGPCESFRPPRVMGGQGGVWKKRPWLSLNEVHWSWRIFHSTWKRRHNNKRKWCKLTYSRGGHRLVTERTWGDVELPESHLSRGHGSVNYCMKGRVSASSSISCGLKWCADG